MAAPRQHHRLVIAILIAATVLGFASVLSIWVKRQALETDTWTNTSTKLLENSDVQEAVSIFLVDTLYTNVDVEAKLSEALPPRAAPLAGPVSGALRELITRIALKALQQPRVQELWSEANGRAHAQFLKLINGGGDALSTSGGAVTLNLGNIVETVGEEAGVDVAGKLPPGVAEIKLIDSDQLGTAQKVVKALKGLSIILPLITLILYALAVYLARGWRREAVRAWGLSWIVIGILVLAVRSIAGNSVTDALASTESVHPSVSAVWDIGTSLLRDGGIAMIGYGVVIFLAAVLAGPLGVAKRARRSLAPLLRERSSAYAAVLLIILLLLWWAPTAGFQRLLPSLILFGLLIAGVEALRRQTMREYPDETWNDVRARWTDRFSRSGPEHAEAAAPAGAGGGRVGELERLAALRDRGVLSPEEFDREKQRILAG